ncbi:MAG: glycosyltransferase family 2 protein [Deltaproteobacteria bacterium]|nr:glycosyltransferase family 2 protein [Deltaproteobacteria bacterium]
MTGPKKLIIQIPCFNEEATLGIALAALPRSVPGFDVVQWLVIDDGSRDRTVNVALAHGVDHVLRVPGNRGLANGFRTGLRACVQLGADVIVNTDADNQYDARDIPLLVKPLLDGAADLVVGARPIVDTAHFSWRKKLLQRLGSFVVRVASRTTVADAPSGFRALTREAASRLNVFNDYTYTLETLIQAGHQRLRVVSVPIRTNADLRPSRLLKSIASYVRFSAITIVRTFVAYRPFGFFGLPGLLALVAGTSLGARFIALFAMGDGGGHVQSLILAAILIGSGTLLVLLALIADLISINRKLLEKIDQRVADLERHLSVPPTGLVAAPAPPIVPLAPPSTTTSTKAAPSA